MYRIDNATAAAALPAATAPGPNPDGFFTGGDPQVSIPATIVDAEWANTVQEELAGAIAARSAGLDKADRSQLGRIILPIFNVKAFGAKGDDLTDDTVAINAAKDKAVAAGGGTVYFPPGVYRVSAAVVADGDNLTFLGAGGRASVFKATTSAGWIGRNAPARVYTAMTTNANRGDSQITLPVGQGAGVAVGDYIELRSDDAGFGPVAATNKAAEARKVLRVTGDVIDIAGQLLFNYTTVNNAEFVVLGSHFVKNLAICDLAFTTLDALTTDVRTLRLLFYQGVTLDNVQIFDAGGGVQIGNSHDLRISNVLIDTLPHFGDSFGYGIHVGGLSSNVQISNYAAYETRHAFTTLADQVGTVIALPTTPQQGIFDIEDVRCVFLGARVKWTSAPASGQLDVRPAGYDGTSSRNLLSTTGSINAIQVSDAQPTGQVFKSNGTTNRLIDNRLPNGGRERIRWTYFSNASAAGGTVYVTMLLLVEEGFAGDFEG